MAPDLPPVYTVATEGMVPGQRWWEAFGDDTLNKLITACLDDNLSLREGWARLEQVHALALIEAAAGRPTLSGEANTAQGRQRTENGQTDTFAIENYGLGLVSGYEADLWGRLRSATRAARLAVIASREDLNTTALTLAATVAERWVRIVSQQMQKDLVQRQTESNLTLQELVELRFRKGLSSALDVFQQRQVVAQTQAQIPLIEQQERLLHNELSLLLGRPPEAVPLIQSTAMPELPAFPAPGLPAELLVMRPDVRSAALRLEEADWRVSAARADRLPDLRFTANASLQSDTIDLLPQNWLLRLAAEMTAPLIDGGRRKAEVLRTRAVSEERLANYRQTVLSAIREVEDAIISEIKLEEHIKGLQTQLAAARNALNEARSRYRNGLDDYLPVLTQILTVQNLERDLIQRETDRIIARLNLYRSLGGRWSDELQSPLQG